MSPRFVGLSHHPISRVRHDRRAVAAVQRDIRGQESEWSSRRQARPEAAPPRPPEFRSRASNQSDIFCFCASTAAARISLGSFSNALIHELTYAVPCRGSCPTPSFSPVIIAAISARNSSRA